MPPMTIRFRLLSALLFLAAVAGSASAQIATGTWRDHPNFTRCLDVAASAELGLTLVAAETAVFALTLDDSGSPL